jgi:hypothetical protein
MHFANTHNIMKAIPLSFFLILLGSATLSAATGTEAARSFVQATILGANPAQGTLTFLDASGRQRVERTTGEAVPVLSTLRRGDQAILSLATAAGGTVVTKVRLHRPEPPAAASGESATAAPASGGSFPVRRSWPNPYAKGTRPPTDRP